jgi:ABC-type nitrate/sulfonate/bicarbonate transport system permease component
MRAIIKHHLAPLLTSLPPARGLLPLALFLIAWQVVQPGPSPYFPGPAEWWTAGLHLAQQIDLLSAFMSTVSTFLLGLALAIVIGSVIGILIGASPLVSRALQPLLEFLRAIPPPATVPIASLLIGYNESMKLVVVVLAALWPILLNISSAVRQIDPLLMEVARSFRLSAWETIRRIIVPSVVPALLLGIRVAIPLTIILALLVEMLTSLPGIGALMIQSQRNFQSSEVYALLVLVGLFGFVVNDVFLVVESLIMRRWPPRASASQ